MSVAPSAHAHHALRANLQQLIASSCVHRRGQGRTLYGPKGQTQDWLIDLRPLFLQPTPLAELCELLWEVVRPALPTAQPVQLAAMETAAIPLLVGMLAAGERHGLTLNGLIIRKERKTTGLANAIEGVPETERYTLLLDDIFNSGDSAEKARQSLSLVGIVPARLLAVIDFGSMAGQAWQQQHQLPVQSLFTLDDFALRRPASTRPPPAMRYTELWRYQAKGANPNFLNPKANPLWVDDKIFVATDAAQLLALDAATGAVAWQHHAKGAHPAKGIWSSPAYHDGVIYFGAYNGDVYALNAASGAMVWQQHYCEWVGSSPCIVPKHQAMVIGLEYERPGQQGSMAALDLATGEKIWEHWLRVYQHGSAVYDATHDRVIFGTNDHDCRSLDAKTGALVWQFATRRSIKYPPALTPDGVVIAACSDGSFYFLRASDGLLLAEIATQNLCYTTPLVVGSRVFAGSSDRGLYLMALAPKIRLEARLDMGAAVFAPPRLVGGQVLFGSTRGVLHELDPESLRLTSHTILPDAITNAVASNADGSRVLVPTYMNSFHLLAREPNLSQKNEGNIP